MPIRGGLDLGGTKIQGVIFDAEREEVLSQARRPTPEEGGPPAIAEALAQCLGEAAEQAGVTVESLDGVGVGSPGAIDAERGCVARAMNLSDWVDPYPLGPTLSERLGVPVAVGNDVDVATQAEFALGAGRDAQSLVGVFWGTGVGGGLVLDNRPWHGRGAAGEIGHVVVKIDGARCPCGRRGCMEAYAGRKAMEEKARREHEQGRKTRLFKLMEDRGRTTLTSGVWARALEQGDELAVELVDRAVAALGAGVASLINVLDVELVVVGGGLGVRFGEPMAKRIAEAMQPHLFVDNRPPAVCVAALGDLGGAIGAALLSQQAHAVAA